MQTDYVLFRYRLAFPLRPVQQVDDHTRMALLGRVHVAVRWLAAARFVGQ